MLSHYFNSSDLYYMQPENAYNQRLRVTKDCAHPRVCCAQDYADLHDPSLGCTQSWLSVIVVARNPWKHDIDI